MSSCNHHVFFFFFKHGTETQRFLIISNIHSFHFLSGPILSAKTGVRTVDCGMVSQPRVGAILK